MRQVGDRFDDDARISAGLEVTQERQVNRDMADQQAAQVRQTGIPSEAYALSPSTSRRRSALRRVCQPLPAGAITPNVETTLKSFQPDSATVGTSGSMEIRCDVVTASARSLPALIICRAAGTVSAIITTCPPTRSVMTGPLPL